MTNYLAGAVLILIIVAVLPAYLKKKKSLSSILKMDLSFNPETGRPGETVYFVMKADAKKSIKSSLIEGELKCLQYSSDFWLTLDRLSFVNTGHMLSGILFSMGKDYMFVKGAKNTYSGALPIPEEAYPTESKPGSKIRWIARVRVHAENYEPAEAVRELLVKKVRLKKASEKGGVMEDHGEVTVDAVSRKNAPARRQDVILSFEGDLRAQQGKDGVGPTRFSFLELEAGDENK